MYDILQSREQKMHHGPWMIACDILPNLIGVLFTEWIISTTTRLQQLKFSENVVVGNGDGYGWVIYTFFSFYLYLGYYDFCYGDRIKGH